MSTNGKKPTPVPIPGNEEAEFGVLSCLIANPRTITKVVETLKPEHFQTGNYVILYEAITNLYKRGKVATQPNIRDELRRMNQFDGIHESDLLGKLEHSIAPLANPITEYAETVRRTSTFRSVISFCQTSADMAYHQDEQTLAWMQESLMRIVLGTDTKPVSTMKTAVDHYLEQFSERQENFKSGKSNGIPTGFVSLNRLLGGGFKRSRLYNLSARPSDGKTSIALNLALNVVKQTMHCLVFSLEMDEEELIQRFLSMETGINQVFLDNGDVTQEQERQLYEQARQLRALDLKIDDRAYLLSEILSKIRQVHAQKRLDLVVIDYLQLVEMTTEGRGRTETRTEEIGKLTKNLKRLARELKIPILLLSQLNRDIEKRSNPVPQLSDINESDHIAQDSDVVMFLYIDELEKEKRNEGKAYKIDVIVRKQRNGPVGQIPLVFQPQLTKFIAPAPEYYHEPNA